jgi:hypothetical protein
MRTSRRFARVPPASALTHKRELPAIIRRKRHARKLYMSARLKDRPRRPIQTKNPGAFAPGQFGFN